MPVLHKEILKAHHGSTSLAVSGNSGSFAQDKVIIKLINDLEQFLRKIGKTKELWTREVLQFLRIPKKQIGLIL